MDSISRLYPAAIIEYADKTVTQISLEWYDRMANDDVKLLDYAIFFHYRDEERAPEVFRYATREELDEAISSLAAKLGG